MLTNLKWGLAFVSMQYTSKDQVDGQSNSPQTTEWKLGIYFLLPIAHKSAFLQPDLDQSTSTYFTFSNLKSCKIDC